jgi:hypothetical protein
MRPDDLRWVARVWVVVVLFALVTAAFAICAVAMYDMTIAFATSTGTT